MVRAKAKEWLCVVLCCFGSGIARRNGSRSSGTSGTAGAQKNIMLARITQRGSNGDWFDGKIHTAKIASKLQVSADKIEWQG